eukprot:Skav236259  [mRNA]  locus=scaffold829:529070:530645:+ [translate_table: standard]
MEQKAEVEHVGQKLCSLLGFSLEPRHFFKCPEEHDELVNVDGPVHILVDFLHHCRCSSLRGIETTKLQRFAELN